MDDQPRLIAEEHAEYVQFRERVLKRIEQAQDDVWNWLPEWQQLRTLVRM